MKRNWWHCWSCWWGIKNRGCTRVGVNGRLYIVPNGSKIEFFVIYFFSSSFCGGSPAYVVSLFMYY